MFLAGAGFPERFRSDLTVVGELGFGTGLNAGAVGQLPPPGPGRGAASFRVGGAFRFAGRRRTRPQGVSRTRRPGAGPDCGLAVAAQGRPPARLREWAGTLTVFHDAADAALAAMDFAADAWFLDGFAPSKNPDMWTAALFDHIARLSVPGAPAAPSPWPAWCGAGSPGRASTWRKSPALHASVNPWRRCSAPAPRRRAPTPLALGDARCGTDGRSSAGDRGGEPGRGPDPPREGYSCVRPRGLGGRRVVCAAGPGTPRLEAADRPHARALLNAWDYAVDLYRRRGLLDATGVLRAASKDGAERLQRLGGLLDERYDWLDAHAASRRIGVQSAPGLWMAAAGSVRPARWSPPSPETRQPKTSRSAPSRRRARTAGA